MRCNLYPGSRPLLLTWSTASLAAASSDTPSARGESPTDSSNRPRMETIRFDLVLGKSVEEEKSIRGGEDGTLHINWLDLN